MTNFVNSLILERNNQDIQALWNTLYSPQVVSSAKENQAAVQWWKYY